MSKIIVKILFFLAFITSYSSVNAQIEDIKKQSNTNNSNSGTLSSFEIDTDNVDNDDFTGDLLLEAFSCCFNNGLLLAVGLVAENHTSIMKLINTDPSVLSFEARMNFAPGYHYTANKNFVYINYLPGVRGNFGAFSTDFRFNVLTEYTDDFPNSFTSWEWLFLFNIEPVESFKLTLGTGIQRENYSDSYFNEHYIDFRFGLNQNIDFLNFDTRFSMDYENSSFPFFEAGINYRKQIAEFSNLFMYINLGGIYQNYYASHDIWAIKGGLVINIH